MSHAHPHPPDGPRADASVRVAVPGDLDEVGAVQAGLWREAYAAVLPESALAEARPALFAQAWRESLVRPPSPAHRLLVAARGDEVVGFVALGPSADPDADDIDAELLVGGVDGPARRGGHGSRLLNAAADTARLVGFARLRVWLLEGDSATRAFLERAGFVPDGARRERGTGPAEDHAATELRFTADIPE